MIPVAAALIFRGGRLLITQRPAGKHLAGLWEFPGGKVEAGETWETALRRELREELGTEVVVGPVFEEVTHRYPNKVVQLRFYVCRWSAGEPRPVQCAALAWATAAELRNYDFPPADARLLDRLRRDPWPQDF